MDAVREQAPPDTLETKVRAAQAELQFGIERAGLRDDPFRHPLQALSSMMGLFPDLVEDLTAAIDRARQPLDPAALVRLEQAAAKGADRRAAELARAHNRRTLLLAVVAMIGTFVVAGAGGFWWGHSAQTAAIASTEAGLSAAFRDGPAAASGWLNLMRANDGNLVRDACTASTVKTADGRRACAIGLWVDPPTNPTPRTEPIRR
jgi:hypothetical protein